MKQWVDELKSWWNDKSMNSLVKEITIWWNNILSYWIVHLMKQWLDKTKLSMKEIFNEMTI